MKKATNKTIVREGNASLLFFVVLLFISFNLKAQTWEAGPFIGAAYYLGDLNPDKHFTDSNLAYGGVLKYNINKRITIGLAASQANIKSDATAFNADNPNSTTTPNLAITLNELALMGEMNFFPYIQGDSRNFWTPYVFGGVATYVSDNINSYSLPFGFGLKVSPVNKVSLNLFWGARKTYTDKLDGVYPDNINSPNPINYEGYNYDWYIFYGLNITFAFRLRKDDGCRNLKY